MDYEIKPKVGDGFPVPGDGLPVPYGGYAAAFSMLSIKIP